MFTLFISYYLTSCPSSPEDPFIFSVSLASTITSFSFVSLTLVLVTPWVSLELLMRAWVKGNFQGHGLLLINKISLPQQALTTYGACASLLSPWWATDGPHLAQVLYRLSQQKELPLGQEHGTLLCTSPFHAVSDVTHCWQRQKEPHCSWWSY